MIFANNSLLIRSKIRYVPLEYLESTGEQWIDTGIVPTNATGVLITFEVPPDNNTDNVLLEYEELLIPILDFG